MKRKPRIDGAVYERTCVYNFHFHLIWVTKYRHEIFVTTELQNEMKSLLTKIAELNNVIIEKIEVCAEHIHMLISFNPKRTPTDIVKAFKGGSARLFLANHPEIRKDKFWGNHIWSRSYYMSTLGNMSREIVEKYIENQHTL